MYFIITLAVVCVMIFYLPFNKAAQNYFTSDRYCTFYALFKITKHGINNETKSYIEDAAFDYFFLMIISSGIGLIWPISIPLFLILLLIRRKLIKKGLNSKTNK